MTNGNEVLPVNGKDIDFDPDDDIPSVQPVPRRHSPGDEDEGEERKHDRERTRDHDARSLNGRRAQGVSRRLRRRRAPRNRDGQSRPPQPPAPPR